MAETLAGKVVLVTGGSRGIGAAIVERFAGAGASVAFTFRNSAEAADELCARLGAAGARVAAYRADARDFGRAREVVDEVAAALGPIDVLINNAATAHYGLFVDLTEEAWDDTIAGALKVVFNYTQPVVRTMCERKGGAIVSISSINGIRGREGSSAYGAAKAAIGGLTRTLAREVGRYGVRVNAIAPGYVDTPSQRATPELIKKLVRHESALPEFTRPEDVAEAALFLGSDASRQITGHVLQIDAGQWI